MQRRSPHRRQIEALEAHWAAAIQASWAAAMLAIIASIDRPRLVERLAIGDVDGAVALLNLDRAYFAEALAALFSAYQEGGAAEAKGIRARVPFNPYSPAAEAEIRARMDTFAAYTIDHATDNATQYFIDGLAAGIAAAALASAMIGYQGKFQKRRTGGLLPLTMSQRNAVSTAQAELTSGDFASYLSRKQRDRRFDEQIRRAAKAGVVAGPALALAASRGLAARLFEARAKAVGEIEAGIAVGIGRAAAVDAVASDAQVNKTWISQRDESVRHTHAELDGQTVPLDGYFQSISGALLRRPRDPMAPANEIMGCRCYMEYSVTRRE